MESMLLAGPQYRIAISLYHTKFPVELRLASLRIELWIAANREFESDYQISDSVSQENRLKSFFDIKKL